MKRKRLHQKQSRNKRKDLFPDMFFILGILVGLLLSIIVMISAKRYQTPIERTLKRVENFTKEKGEVFVETDEEREVQQFLDNLPIENAPE